MLAKELELSTSNPLASFGLSHTLVALVTSSLGAASLAELLAPLLSSGDIAGPLLGETLIDLVEVLEEAREDCDDLATTVKDMDVDGASDATSAAAKAIEVVKLLLSSAALPSYIPNLLLSPNQLLALGLHPTPHFPAALQRSSVKRSTTLFFKQSKYNLLRESSEGFSRLIVLLTGPDALVMSSSTESAPARAGRARRVWARVMGLIGYFNLSPPRVLDIVLEVASCHVAAHWRFFLDLLRCSPWGASAAVHEGKGKQKADWVEAEMDEIVDSMRSGDRVLAQVMGFKFGFYQRPDCGDTPIGLVYVAALLVKHGFVSLADLLPFLSPDDVEMANIRSRFLASAGSRSGTSNALVNAVLVDEDAPSSQSGSAAEASSGPPKPPPEQRIQLVQALLAIGDQGAALFVLAKFPWIAQSHPPIADLILRNVAHALQPLYDAYTDARLPSGEYDLDAVAPTHIDRRARETVPTLLSPVPPSTATKAFEFFYPDWAADLEVWSSPEEIYQKGLRWLSLVRGLGGRSVSVMVKMCRIIEAHFAALAHQKEAALGLATGSIRSRDQMRSIQPTPEEMEPWLHLLRLSILPSLSVSSKTAPFDVEAWALLKHLPYPVRYCLYGEWRDSTCHPKGRNSCPAASSAAAECTREIKKALSRVTASQSGSSGSSSQAAERGPARSLAKLSHSNPCALWTTAVNQVKAYTNIGQFIVEAGRYMTQLSMDVATFTLVDTLSDDAASRLNPQGTGVAQWLESLATFVGDFNRRYANMDLEPVLQFVINRLVHGESADLTILGSLISVMSGASPVLNFAVSDEQLAAYAGGREIIREAFYTTQLAIARPAEVDGAGQPKSAPVEKAKNVRKSLPRLVNALRETKLAVPIWVALAQTRQGAVDRMPDAPLKAMEITQDSCHDIFMQYGSLLAEHLGASEHIALLPNLTSLVSDFGLDYAMAFQILRAKLNAALEENRLQEKADVQMRLQAAKDRLGSPQSGATPLPQSPTSPQSPTLELMQVDADGDGKEAVNGTPVAFVPPPKAPVWWPAALYKTMQEALALLPHEVSSCMSAPFFVIFWQLQMSDIAFSLESYTKAIERISRFEADLATWKTANSTDNRLERARLRARVEVLAAERDAQQAHVSGPMRRRLRLESSKWFGKAIADKGLQRLLGVQLHQYCFYPRALMSPADGAFVAKFVRLAHDLGTVGFSTVFAINNFFNDQLAACIFSCTESEARNLGRCLAGIMSFLDDWHADESRYKREALGIRDGSKTLADKREAEADKMDTDDKPAAANGASTPHVPPSEPALPGMFFRRVPKAELQPMSWTQFRNFYAKCHNHLAKALLSCWKEEDFMHTKNAITVGLQVIKHFPVMETNGKQIEAVVNELMAGKTRTVTSDVQALSKSYAFHLKKRQQLRPFVSPHLFHSAGARPPAPAPAKKTHAATSSGKAADSATASASVSAESAAPKAEDAAKNGAGGVDAPTKTLTPAEAQAQVLRQKLEESRRNATVKEEKPATSTAEQAAKTSGSPAPPAGPRATRSAAAASPGRAPSRRGSPARGHEPPAGPASKPAPTGPAADASGPQAQGTAPGSMGPPKELSIDEARAAARARKFGTITGGDATPPAAPRGQSPAPAARRDPAQPAAPLKRSGSVESRASERSKRDRPDDDAALRGSRRDARDTRDGARRDDPPHLRERGERDVPDRANGTTSRAESRPSGDGRPDDRRDRDRDRRRDRDERGRERDERARGDRNGGGRHDDRDARHDERRERDRARGGERERDERDKDDRRRDRDRDGRRDPRDEHKRPRDEDERDRARRDERDDARRGSRDERRGGREHHDERERRDSRGKDEGRDTRTVAPAARPVPAADKRDGGVELLPSTSQAGTGADAPPPRVESRKAEPPREPAARVVSNGQGDRIIDAPRGRHEPPRRPEVRPSDAAGTRHAGPPADQSRGPPAAREHDRRPEPPHVAAGRPDASRDLRDQRDQRSARDPSDQRGPPSGEGRPEPPHVAEAPTRPAAAARPDPAPARNDTPERPTSMSIRSAAPVEQPKPANLLSRLGMQPTSQPPPNGRGSPAPPGGPANASPSRDERKRPLEDAAPAAREESPGASKRARTSRERGGRREGGGRDGGSRLLAGAMRAAHDHK